MMMLLLSVLHKIVNMYLHIISIDDRDGRKTFHPPKENDRSLWAYPLAWWWWIFCSAVRVNWICMDGWVCVCVDYLHIVSSLHWSLVILYLVCICTASHTSVDRFCERNSILSSSQRDTNTQHHIIVASLSARLNPKQTSYVCTYNITRRRRQRRVTSATNTPTKCLPLIFCVSLFNCECIYCSSMTTPLPPMCQVLIYTCGINMGKLSHNWIRVAFCRALCCTILLQPYDLEIARGSLGFCGGEFVFAWLIITITTNTQTLIEEYTHTGEEVVTWIC